MRKARNTMFALLLLPFLGQGQMVFEEGDWTSVKAKAKQENKIIFIDLYTTWCGPCKVMAKKIFPLKEVGDFYNANFINYKIDAEKGEGIDLNKKFGVTAYPTYIFADANGEFLHQAVGTFPADGFIEEGKTALDPSKQLKNLVENGENIGKEEMPAYLRYLKSQNLPHNDKLESYLTSLTSEELLTTKTFQLIGDLGGRRPEGFTYELMFRHKDGMSKVVGEQRMDNYFFKLFLEEAYSYRARKEPYQPVLDKVNKLGFDFAQKIYDTIELGALIYTDKNYAAFAEQAPALLEKYGSTSPELKYYPVFAIGSLFFLRDPALEKYVISLAEELVNEEHERASNIYGTLASGYLRANRLNKALQYFDHALQIATTQTEFKGVSDQIDFVKKRQAAIEAGIFTFNAEGYEKYNGAQFLVKYMDPIKVGKYRTTPPITITEGKFTVNGDNVHTPVPAEWIISDNGKTVASGKVILEPGSFKASPNEGLDFYVENAGYNYEVLYAWMLNPRYMEADKALKAFETDSNFNMKDKEMEEKYNQLVESRNKAKMGYVNYAFNSKTDPMIKLLIAHEGQLHKDSKKGADNLAYLKELYPNHILVKNMEKQEKK